MIFDSAVHEDGNFHRSFFSAVYVIFLIERLFEIHEIGRGQKTELRDR